MTVRTHHYRRPRGVTMLIAIALLALVAVALVGTAQLLRHDVQRSFDDRTALQLRALLLAGMTEVKSQLTTDGSLPPHTALALPPQLAEASLTADATRDGTDWIVSLLTIVDDRQLGTTCIFIHSDEGWIVRDATVQSFKERH